MDTKSLPRTLSSVVADLETEANSIQNIRYRLARVSQVLLGHNMPIEEDASKAGDYSCINSLYESRDAIHRESCLLRELLNDLENSIGVEPSNTSASAKSFSGAIRVG